MTILNWLEAAGIIVAVLVAVVLAVTYLLSRIRKQSDNERDRLLQLRADRISELESKVDNLTTEVARLTGMFEGLQTLKASEIAFETAHILIDSGFVHKGEVR